MHSIWVFVVIIINLVNIMGCVPSPPSMVKEPPNEKFFSLLQSGNKDALPSMLECEAKGDPMPTYRWIKNGLPFDYWAYDDRLLQQPGRGTLIFLKSDIVDEGLYQCFAENEHGISVSNSVLLKKSELDPFDDEEVKEFYVEEGEPLTLDCNPPTGSPKPVILWVTKSNAGALSSANNARRTVDPEGRLHFSNVTRQDMLEEASYACIAHNTFTIEYKIGGRINIKIEANSGQASHSPILQYVSPESILALKGQVLKLHCIFGGTPHPEIVWSKRNSQLEGSHFTFENYGKTLVINSVDFSDEGVYECTASNGIGSQKSHRMEVKVNSVPQWIQIPNDTIATERETVSFKCNASSIPEPQLQWYVNGIPIEKAPENSRRVVDGSVLTIRDLNATVDTSVFQCNASNRHGYAFHNFYLNVMNVKNQTERIEALEHRNKEVEQDKMVSFKCNAETDQDIYLRIEWLFKGDKIEIPGHLRIKMLNGSTLIITTNKEYDSGVYTFEGNSGHELISPLANLTVQRVPNAPKIIGVTCHPNTALVEWTSTGDGGTPIQSYSIQLNSSFSPDDWKDAFVDIPAPDTKFKVALESSFTNFTFRVIARNKIGFSEPSLPSTMCSTSGDSNSFNLKGTATLPDNLLITWQPMTSIEENGQNFYYKLFWKRDDMPSEPWETKIIDNGKESSLLIANLHTFKPYRIKVETHNYNGKVIIKSHEVVVYSGEDKPLESPQNLRLLQIVGPKTALFKWDPVRPESVRGHFKGYKIQIWDEVSAHIREIIVTPNKTQAVAHNLRPYAKNFAQILVFNDAYNSDPSNKVSFYTPEGVPGPVASFEAMSNNSTSLYLYWTPPAERNGILLGYRIFYEKANETELMKPLEALEIAGPMATNAKLVGLTPQTKYRVTIYATTSKGLGDPFFIEVSTKSEDDKGA